MNATFENLLRDATHLTQSGRLMEATAAIQRALSGGSVGAPVAPTNRTRADHREQTAPADVLEGCVFEVPGHETAHSPAPSPTPRHTSSPNSGTGSFSTGRHQHAGLTRDYKLFVPAGNRAEPLPLLVMLHGCTQNPDDFAAGTGMNGLAQEQGFCVLYPAQSTDANPSRCWNWFKHNHQARGRGETAWIADLTQTVMKAQGSDPTRVYIAGLSAGGAMAALVGAAYPELFAALGVHSGLAPGAAKDLPGALAAMKGAGKPARGAGLPLPVIVFHGDQDKTVHPNNAAQIVQAALQAAAPTLPAGAPQVEHGQSAGGQRFTRSVHGDGRAEDWQLHGAGHAWSGGQAAGSYTDPRGADASREMLRFFRAHPLLGKA